MNLRTMHPIATNVPAATTKQNASSAITLGWLCDLESSLLKGQIALLARDLAGMEAATRAQAHLLNGFAQAWKSTLAAQPLSSAESVAVARVLHLSRVQAALLRRAERWHSVLQNLLAGTAASYDPGGHATFASAPVSTPSSTTPDPEASVCRA